MSERKFLYHYLLVVVYILLTGFGCGVAGGGGGAAPAPPILSYKYVDVSIGDDVSGDGSPGKPFRTITKGLSTATDGYTVKVSPGTYDGSIGEVFPLQLKQNVTLEGDPDIMGNGGSPTIISGAGTYATASLGNQPVTIVCADGAKILGLRIEAGNGTAIWCEGASMETTIQQNTIINSDYGIVVSETAQPYIYRNNISQNNISGIEIFTQATPEIRSNTISNNSYGIVVNNSSLPDLGTSVSPGDNTVTGNAGCDLNNISNRDISAIGNIWDADQFLFTASSSCSAGANIANTGTGSVLYQYVPLNVGQIFPGTNLITLTFPANGAVIATNEPSFTWSPTGSSYVFLGVFNRPISIQNNGIANITDLVWVWHSGLGHGREGDLTFQDGVASVNGNFSSSGTPQPLVRGKTYWWAVWAWDNAGVKILYSSEEYHFTVSP